MKLMIINNSTVSNFKIGLIRKLLGIQYYENCSSIITKEILKREKPGIVYTNFIEPVNGDNDVVTMISSIDVNTRLRVIIFNPDLAINNLREAVKNFILPGKNQHKLDTL